ncbi:hypothetical protein COU18_01420 [Candidatus Kaiserbacteria bacterium CG10_big_fil_rev_8_21_14_0_10_51_14]|uniref:Peptidoglycan binding-like domain-containing protein n=1 Tax=Candidatus Kaiserbacteria bacterium CG10_big_fil_rev_8_21_14_0_10_51_14 TaxID=1974610 RepID=A0A2H0UC95_9BACT|nr:MAG: hypothetical protein COU18_01420 [Candidatus Kaiserbacteria bacterium CG10_big_fil_rev_8_21_14_0_10_51_14]
MNKHVLSRTGIVLSSAALLFALTWAWSAAAATITSTLDFGSRGSDVTSLQQFLAADATLYPEGLVTGYYGSLTAAAVQRFQCRQNIVCEGDAASTGYGRVGPRTLAAVNAAMAGGAGTPTTGDVSAPIMTPVIVSTTTTSATFSWSTNELARGTLYYSMALLPLLEGSGGTAAVVGGLPISESTFSLTHSLSISALATSTMYFYAVKSEDTSGNVQYTWPTFFRTGQ